MSIVAAEDIKDLFAVASTDEPGLTIFKEVVDARDLFVRRPAVLPANLLPLTLRTGGNYSQKGDGEGAAHWNSLTPDLDVRNGWKADSLTDIL